MNHEVNKRPKLSMFYVIIDVLVWLCCIAFAGTVAVSYLMVTL